MTKKSNLIWSKEFREIESKINKLNNTQQSIMLYYLMGYLHEDVEIIEKAYENVKDCKWAKTGEI